MAEVTNSMKTIVAFVGGGERDLVILQTALAAATPLAAHLRCLHAHVPATLAARHARLEFARGAAIGRALDQLDANAQTFSAVAARNVRTFCADAGIELCDDAGGADSVTASYHEESGNDLERLRALAAQADLVVIGRARQKQGLAPDTLEYLVRHGGRPVLVAATAAAPSLTGTIVVLWKDATSVAAVTAALPLLNQAQRVVFVAIARDPAAVVENIRMRAGSLIDRGAEIKVLDAGRRDIPDVLAAFAEECGADLVVAGAYGRSRGSEILFGSCTDKLIERCDRPILLVH